MGKRNTVFLSLGSNLGDRQRNIESAIFALKDFGTVQRISTTHETKPWGKIDQPGFLNAAVKMETELSALEFLKKAQEIEQKLGRIRTEKWGPRTIDIDLLLWNDETIDQPDLKIPHPHMNERDFVLKPLSEIR